MNTQTTEEKIVGLLSTTHRAGMKSLVGYLLESKFFEAPASSRFHGSYKGGLAVHSLRVFELLSAKFQTLKLDKKSGYGQMPMKIKAENIIIAGLLHDLCKINAYKRTKADDGWTNNRDKEKGHALLSIARIKKFIELEKLEEIMIRFHMGLYGCFEFQDKEGDPNGEYPLRSDHTKVEGLSKEESSKRRYGKSLANVWYHNPICKVMSMCDEIATFEEKAKGE